MRTNNRPKYCVVFRRGHADEHMGHDVFRTKAEAKRHAAMMTAAHRMAAEVCEMTTLYELEVTP